MRMRWGVIGSGALLALITAGCSSPSTASGPANSPHSTAAPGPGAPSSAPAPAPATSAPAPGTPSQAPPPAPPAAPAPVNPASVVEEYFAAINAHDYSRAWALGGNHLGSSYAEFAAGFANTAHDAVTIVSVSGNEVGVDLTATKTDGSRQVFTGSYTVTGQAISSASIRQVQAGSNGAPLCGAPANPYGYNFCGNGGRVTRPASDICAYFDCIENFWNGRGYMVECADGTYSMSGGIDGACSEHGDEWRPVYGG